MSLIISVKHKDNVMHIPIGRDTEGWRLEEMAFPNVKTLISYYHRKQKPLTKDSGAVLRVGIKKYKWLIDDRQLNI